MRGGGRPGGFVLTTVLILSLALLAVALATAALATLHLHTARHAERAQRARIVARSGVELALAALEARARAEGALPHEAPRLPAGHGLDLRIVGYERIDAARAEVEVEGRAAGASAIAGAELILR